MLKIRRAQIKVLEDESAANFEKNLVQHIQGFAPKHAEVIKTKGVRKVVSLGIERSKKYGFNKRGPIRFYVELMFMFGSDFDTDFQLPWAAGLLNNEIINDDLEKADYLHAKMLEYIEVIAGPDSEFALKALRKIVKVQFEDYKAAGTDFDQQIVAALTDVYPQKVNYLGKERIHTLLKRAKESAEKHQVTSEKGNALFAALIFSLGHGFANDPLFPWISNTLNDEKVADPNERAERLEKKMKTYSESALKHLEEYRK